jgi:hypothetical protein
VAVTVCVRTGSWRGSALSTETRPRKSSKSRTPQSTTRATIRTTRAAPSPGPPGEAFCEVIVLPVKVIHHFYLLGRQNATTL